MPGPSSLPRLPMLLAPTSAVSSPSSSGSWSRCSWPPSTTRCSPAPCRRSSASCTASST
ncbi:hypothetical protein ACFPRL_07850 [Pseudoclavibacter helvolus]